MLVRVTVTFVCIHTTLLVDVVLDDSSNDHGRGTAYETGEDFLDGGETDALSCQKWIDELVKDRYEDDESKRINVVHDVWTLVSFIYSTRLNNSPFGTPLRSSVTA